MINKILKTVNKFDMISPGDKILAGVSGGADSMLLLNFLISVRDIYSLDIAVAHIEHGIRGKESLSDAEFVKKFCFDNNIEYHQLSINAPEEAAQAGLGVEEYSRQKRYEFFDSIPCDKIATAHNLSDNIETLIFRLVRGTGLKGACGIPPVRGKIIRPLIETTSSEIRDYCKCKGIEYRIDSTNSDSFYSRNYIRNEIVNKFSLLNGDYEHTISNFISNVNEDEHFLDAFSQSAFEKCMDGDTLCIEKLNEYDIAVVKRVIIKFLLKNKVKIDRTAVEKVMSLLHHPSKVQLFGNIYAVSSLKCIRIADFGCSTDNVSFVSEILNISEFNSKSVDFYCDYDKISGDFIIRTRLAHDTISPAGRNCSKSLKKLYNELKIPVEKRSTTLVVADQKGVIGIVGYCIDERVKPDNNTKRFLSVKLPSED